MSGVVKFGSWRVVMVIIPLPEPPGPVQVTWNVALVFGAGVVTPSLPLVPGVLKPAPLAVQEVALVLVQRSVTESPGFTVWLEPDHEPELTWASRVAAAAGGS